MNVDVYWSVDTGPYSYIYFAMHVFACKCGRILYITIEWELRKPNIYKTRLSILRFELNVCSIERLHFGEHKWLNDIT